VKLPPGVNRLEWIAAHTVSIHQEVVTVIALLEDVCTDETCPAMTAVPIVKYKWQGDKKELPRSVSAPEYMKLLAEFSYNILSSREIMPNEELNRVPQDFMQVMQKLLSRMMRVYAHSYMHHWDTVQKFQATAHLGCCFKHYLAFVREFNLVTESDLAPMMGYIKKMEVPHQQSRQSAGAWMDESSHRPSQRD